MPPPACKLGDMARKTKKPRRGAARIAPSPPVPERSAGGFRFFTKLPAEIQQMVWAEHIKALSCHHFTLSRLLGVAAGSRAPRWTVELSVKPKKTNPSAYRQRQLFLEVNDHGLIDTLRRMAAPMDSISLQRDSRVHIDGVNDLVILDFQRGIGDYAFTWWEHNSQGVGSMNMKRIQRRLRRFRKVAVHYGARHSMSTAGGPFQCCCVPPPMLQCDKFKACPLELACFLDCFQNLEEFYFIVENNRNKATAGFTVQYKKQVQEQGYRVVRDVINKKSKRTTETVELKRFFDNKHEFLQHASPSVLGKLSLDNPSPYDTPRECLIKAMNIFKSKSGSEPFIQSLASRTRVQFGLLIPYECNSRVTRSQG